MKIVTCCRCGMQFGIMDAFHDTALRMRENLTFYCPAGHPQSFVSGETEAEKMRRERDRLKQQIAYEADIRRQETERADAAERSAAAYKGVATRIKNRIKVGVCPCCNRTFQDLARHMASKHPDIDNVVELPLRSA